MKVYKIIGTFLWVISAMMAGMGLVVFFSNNPVNSNINMALIKFSVILFAMAFTMMTPLYLNLLFRDTFWKNQKEMDELREKHNESIKQYNDAKEKLISKILQE